MLFICKHINTDTCQVTDTTVYIVNLYTFACFLLPEQQKYCCPKNSTVFILFHDGHMSYRYLSALWGKRRINSGWGGPISLYMAIVGGISPYMPVLGGLHLSLHASTWEGASLRTCQYLGAHLFLHASTGGGYLSLHASTGGEEHLSLHDSTPSIRDWLTQGSNTRSKASHGVPCFLELMSLCVLVSMVRQFLVPGTELPVQCPS